MAFKSNNQDPSGWFTPGSFIGDGTNAHRGTGSVYIPPAPHSSAHYQSLAGESRKRRIRDLRRSRSQMLWRWRLKQLRKLLVLGGLLGGIATAVGWHVESTGFRSPASAIGTFGRQAFTGVGLSASGLHEAGKARARRSQERQAAPVRGGAQ